jgi:hypothetical protein
MSNSLLFVSVERTRVPRISRFIDVHRSSLEVVVSNVGYDVRQELGPEPQGDPD